MPGPRRRDRRTASSRDPLEVRRLLQRDADTFIAVERRTEASDCAAAESGQSREGAARRWTASRIPAAGGMRPIGRISGRHNWRRVLETLGQSSGALEHGPAIDQLIEADVASWTGYREEMWVLAQSFRVSGGRTAFLSNGVPEAMARIRAERPVERWFDVVVVSCEVGVAKPDPTCAVLYLPACR